MAQTSSDVARPPARNSMGLAQGALLWSLLFMICCGLGYGTLNRYDPRALGDPDAAIYYRHVIHGPIASEGNMQFRVLVTTVAKPFYWLAQGRVGTWNPVFFGLLASNAMFTATTVFLLIVVGYAQLGDLAAALLGGTLYLLNFDVPNLMLSGLVDSGEACFLMAVTWTLFSERWWLLPIWGILGALSKETFVPLSIVFASTWWLASARNQPNRFSRGAWIAAMLIVEMATITLVQSTITGHLVWPWQFAAGLNARSDYLGNFVNGIADRYFWYVFIWLLPLGVWRLGRFPRPWVLATSAAAFLVFVLDAYVQGPPGATGRPAFDVAGPILSLSAAVLLCGSPRLFGASGRADGREGK